jgi:hypothetical protein
MCSLYRADRRDVCGVLLRSLYEASLVSLYALYGGDEAWETLGGAYVGEVRKLPDVVKDPPQREEIDSWTGPTDRLKWIQLAADVGALLESHGDSVAREVSTNLYDLLYRGESLFSTHGGMGVVAGHLLDGDERLGIIPARDPGPAKGQIIMGAVIEAHLASHVFNVFGVSSTTVTHWRRRWPTPTTTVGLGPSCDHDLYVVGFHAVAERSTCAFAHSA